MAALAPDLDRSGAAGAGLPGGVEGLPGGGHGGAAAGGFLGELKGGNMVEGKGRKLGVEGRGRLPFGRRLRQGISNFLSSALHGKHDPCDHPRF